MMNYGLGNAMMQRDGAPVQMMPGAQPSLGNALMPQQPNVPQQMMGQGGQFGKVFEPGLGGLFGVLPMLLKHGPMGILPSLFGNTGAGKNFKNWFDKI